MRITAKFKSKCGDCGGWISPGDRIDYERGCKAVHVDCEMTEPGCHHCRYIEGRRVAQIWEECESCGTEPIYV